MEKKFERDTFHLQPLSIEDAERVLAKTRDFVSFLESSGTSTHPDVRVMLNVCTTSIAGLVGQVEASKLRGNTKDEMDHWEENGIQAVPI